MDNTISLFAKPNTKFVKFFIIFVVILITIFLISNYFAAKRATEAIVDLTIADAIGIADEIYRTGEVFGAIKDLPLEAALLAKMTAEMERILAKTVDYPGCEVYYLHARVSGSYPVLGYGNTILGYEYLNVGEVWKVGQTCNGEDGRYPSNIYYKSNNLVLTNKLLQYQHIYKGTYKQCLILEKLLIYTYPLWSGHHNLPKPPGCKIFR